MDNLYHIILGALEIKYIKCLAWVCHTVGFQWEVIPSHLPLLILYNTFVLLKAATVTGFYKFLPLF